MKNEPKQIKRICIFGAGGVGGFFGGKMAFAVNGDPELDYEIYFVARGEHLRKIRENGLILETAGVEPLVCKPALAVDDFAKLPPVDLVLITVKSYDLEDAIRGMAAHIGRKTMIIPLLNGIDIYRRIREGLPQGLVFPGCVYQSGFVAEPGKVVHLSGDLIIYGKDPGHLEAVPEEVFKLFRDTGIHYRWMDDPNPAIWEKFIFIAAFGLITADSGKTVREVMADSRLREYTREIMHEITRIATAEWINLPDNVVSESLAKGNSVAFNLKTSLQRDVEQRKKFNEADLFGGTILRLGRKHGIATPVTETIYHYIKNVTDSPRPEYF